VLADHAADRRDVIGLERVAQSDDEAEPEASE
jgi:hypothetical protein